MSEFKGGWFKGREAGELEHVKTLFWHDGPIVFTARDRAGSSFLVIATAQGTVDGAHAIVGADMAFALFQITPAECASLEREEGDGCFNSVALSSAMRHSGVETCGARGGEGIPGPRLNLEQAQDLAIGEPVRPERVA